ncbi:outer membrane protein assembly factor BamE [Thiomicrorhabdus sp. ZW0627]|uniref:outer membrane protein assembly factor BamE n=1 Tax=Thiomicrorhabdus sp. ZW0627 TaxID=3039774 RepID=UPI002436EBDA|nr:outer membrane protein assembly factor BamE [Thiomicrorhabdus sp. ZW0627]MDG6772720.1 outer membrane protein assembly factor BamE [Thiomicrorhabdus sp. ZW0627]
MKMTPIMNSVLNAALLSARKPFKLFLALSLSGSVLTGCSILSPYKATLTQGTIISQESVGLLQEGLTKDQARQLFGPPIGEDPFNPNHWSYAFYTTDDNFHPDAVKRLTINFDADQMIESWEISDEAFPFNGS